MRKLLIALLVAGCAACSQKVTLDGNAEGGVMGGAASERDAFTRAQAHCAKHGRNAKITQIVPMGDGSVVFECR